MCAKKNPCFGRVVEGLFLSTPGQKGVLGISDSNYKKTNVGYV